MRSIYVLLFLFPLFLVESCERSTKKPLETEISDAIPPNTSLEEEVIINLNSETNDDSIHVKLSLEKLNESEFNFHIKMDLHGESWIVSPLDYDYPHGSLQIEYNKNEHIKLVDQIVQTPESKLLNDPNHDQLYKVISGATTLEQKLKIISNEDFVVQGNIFFVLEPVCNPYQIDFSLIYKSGNFIIEETPMRIAK